jgi:elongation factor G
MEKFFDDPNTITEDEMHEAIRKACIDISIIPMMCGSSFKNKGVQTALDAVCRYLPSPVDIEAVGTNPDTGEANHYCVMPIQKNHLLPWHSKS